MPECDGGWGGGHWDYDRSADTVFKKARRIQEQKMQEVEDLMVELEKSREQALLDKNCITLVNALKPKEEMVINRDYISSHNAHIKEKRHFEREDGYEVYTLVMDGGSGIDVPKEVFDRVKAGDDLIGVYLLP
jgi:hypothetical protein